MKRIQWPIIATCLSLLACYGTLIAIAALAAMGITITLNEGVWAGAIVVFAALAVVALGVSRTRHGANVPVILAGVGAVAISYAMFVDYSRITELIGFALLAGAVWLDWRRS